MALEIEIKRQPDPKEALTKLFGPMKAEQIQVKVDRVRKGAE